MGACFSDYMQHLSTLAAALAYLTRIAGRMTVIIISIDDSWILAYLFGIHDER